MPWHRTGTYRQITRVFACRLRSLPSGSWRLRPPVVACSTAAGGVAGEGPGFAEPDRGAE